jgi:hypothetical protein
MKKIFTLTVGLLMATLLIAADRHRPSVIINSSRNFEVVIDGRSFRTSGRTITLDHLRNGRHNIRVYELRRGFRGHLQKRLVSQSNFRLRNNDVLIRIDRDGDVMFKETRGRNFDVRDRDRMYNDQHGWKRNMDDDDDRDFRRNRD